MKIYYISIGSFCYSKIIIRETNRELSESLPFDFNSSPHLSGIVNILQELHDTNKYEIDLKDILEIYNENELSVSEKNMYLVHFFKKEHLIKNIDQYPADANTHIDKDIIKDIKDKFNKRFERLLNILNDKNNILCFLRIENYDNCGWRYELDNLVKVLSLFKNPNKFLIYSQNLIDQELDFYKSNVLNYDYNFPILFFKYYFYDIEIINNKDNFIKIFTIFEDILNSENIVNISNNDIIEKYYLDKDIINLDKNTGKIFKLTNINYFTMYSIENDFLYINNVISGYDKYLKRDSIYYKI